MLKFFSTSLNGKHIEKMFVLKMGELDQKILIKSNFLLS